MAMHSNIIAERKIILKIKSFEDFTIASHENGKLKAVNVTFVGGAPLTPPKREKRRNRKPKPTNTDGEANDAAPKSGGQNGNKKKKETVGKFDPPFHDVITADVKAKITEKGLQLVRNTVDVARGGSRIKLGQGGYASLVDASGIIGEGSYVCEESSKVVFTWERGLEFKDGQWQSLDISKLVASFSLTDGK